MAEIQKAGPAEAAAKRGWRAPRGGGVKACTAQNCKRPYRAKGYCFFHYKKWVPD